MGWNRALQIGRSPSMCEKKKKNIFGASDLEHCLPKNLVKRTARGIETSIFKTEVQHAIHDATGALLSRNFASDSLYLLRLQRAWFSMVYREEGLCEKTTFQALKKCFLHTNPMKLRQARLCKKTTFQALKKCFLHTNLMKLRQARLCKKNNFSGSKKNVFYTLTLWNSDKPGFAKKQLFRL